MENNLISQKELILTLIKDNLVNTRLINGLNELGFYSTDYHLHLAELIFKLMGFEDEQETLFETYLEWCAKPALEDIFKDEKLLDKYANEIYKVLLVQTKKS